MARRARVVLACATGADNQRVARRLRLAPATVGQWRQRFLEHRVAGLFDEPRPGAPRQITDAQIEAVVVRTLESTPRGATHWSTREMARATGLSAMTISRIWRAFGLQPHRSETFKRSPDPRLSEQVRDIVGLYLHPPAHAVVFCVAIKPQVQALDRTAPLLPLQPGQVERRTHDYRRHGTTSLYAALNVKTGKVLGETFSRQRTREFRRFLVQLDAAVPAGLAIHVILDNASAHKSAAMRRWLARHPRFHFHLPAPVQIADHHGDSALSTIAMEILLLSKMNWNSAGFCGALPITIRFSRSVGDIMREIPADREPMPQFKFYT